MAERPKKHMLLQVPSQTPTTREGWDEWLITSDMIP